MFESTHKLMDTPRLQWTEHMVRACLEEQLAAAFKLIDVGVRELECYLTGYSTGVNEQRLNEALKKARANWGLAGYLRSDEPISIMSHIVADYPGLLSEYNCVAAVAYTEMLNRLEAIAKARGIGQKKFGLEALKMVSCLEGCIGGLPASSPQPSLN